MDGLISRDPEGATHRSYDLAIVGGGIYGITVALEAAQRGLRALLIERDDFGGATTWNSLRIIHGGLRYLQSLDLRRFFESIAERRWFLRTFPELVRPLACLMPLYGRGLKRPSVFRFALRVNDVLSWRRNHGVRDDCHIPAGRVLSVGETVDLFPSVERRGLVGGAWWTDAAMPTSQRVVIELFRWAAAAGATCLNYVEVESVLTASGRVDGLSAIDRESGAVLEYRAPIVINCAGPWCREVSRRADRDVPSLFHSSLAFNVLLDVEPPSRAAIAVAPRVPGGRTYFLYAWKGRLLAGTCHLACRTYQEPSAPSDGEVDAFLGELRAAVPGLAATREKLSRVFWGHLPARRPGTTEIAVRPVVVDHAAAGGPRGLFSISGVKFTTARLVGARMLDAIAGRRADRGRRGEGSPRPALRNVSSIETLRRRLETEPERVEAEIDTLVKTEAVLQPDDLLLRRTDWGLDPDCAKRVVEAVSRHVAAASGRGAVRGDPQASR